MTYIAINDGTAEIAETEAALLTAVQDRVRQNAAHTFASRLKRHGVSFPPGISNQDTAASVDFGNFVGPVGTLYLDAAGAPVTGTDIRSVGMFIATPPQRPLCLTIPWPVSAGARAIRIVVASRVPTITDNDNVMEILAHVWDGSAWYPCPPGMQVCERFGATGFASPDTMRIAEPWRSTSAFASIDDNMASPDDIRWDALTVQLTGRESIDRTVQLRDDSNRQGVIVLSILSRVDAAPTAADTTTFGEITDPRYPCLDLASRFMPGLCRDGASPLLFTCADHEGVLHWHFAPCVNSEHGHANADVRVACWPPLTESEIDFNGTTGAVSLFYSSFMILSSVGISEIGDA